MNDEESKPFLHAGERKGEREAGTENKVSRREMLTAIGAGGMALMAGGLWNGSLASAANGHSVRNAVYGGGSCPDGIGSDCVTTSMTAINRSGRRGISCGSKSASKISAPQETG
ncbi:hypothetical protein [Paenibacillus oceani]|uniref:Uncharacterized protein n=1 Tax=Paenibacillus oceani TaxID=2772510 RepID=A0A927C795_9BACL|nr:hypothetical protein [Paenibacillus oceani]MBD2861443.1 hypothetical protein [Paenibacillus oceani]